MRSSRRSERCVESEKQTNNERQVFKHDRYPVRKTKNENAAMQESVMEFGLLQAISKREVDLRVWRFQKGDMAVHQYICFPPCSPPLTIHDLQFTDSWKVSFVGHTSRQFANAFVRRSSEIGVNISRC